MPRSASTSPSPRAPRPDRRGTARACGSLPEHDVLDHAEVGHEVELLVDHPDPEPLGGPRPVDRDARAVDRRSRPRRRRTAPARIFISVDLPAPFSPTSACTSPAPTSNETPSSARTPGNDFVIAAHLEQRRAGRRPGRYLRAGFREGPDRHAIRAGGCLAGEIIGDRVDRLARRSDRDAGSRRRTSCRS